MIIIQKNQQLWKKCVFSAISLILYAQLLIMKHRVIKYVMLNFIFAEFFTNLVNIYIYTVSYGYIFGIIAKNFKRNN